MKVSFFSPSPARSMSRSRALLADVKWRRAGPALRAQPCAYAFASANFFRLNASGEASGSGSGSW